MRDYLRDSLSVGLFCAIHKEQKLKLCTDEESRVGADSAFTMDIKIMVHPCYKCGEEISKIKNAVKALMELNDE